MNMTEIPQYMEFGSCLAEGRMDDAITCLDECIDIVDKDAGAKARLLQFKGNTLWQMKKKAGAIASYEESFKTLPDSPLIMLGYSRFLATQGLAEPTELILSKLETLLHSWQRKSETEHSLSSYFDRITEVKKILKENSNRS